MQEETHQKQDIKYLPGHYFFSLEDCYEVLGEMFPSDPVLKIFRTALKKERSDGHANQQELFQIIKSQNLALIFYYLYPSFDEYQRHFKAVFQNKAQTNFCYYYKYLPLFYCLLLKQIDISDKGPKINFSKILNQHLHSNSFLSNLINNRAQENLQHSNLLNLISIVQNMEVQQQNVEEEFDNQRGFNVENQIYLTISRVLSAFPSASFSEPDFINFSSILPSHKEQTRQELCDDGKYEQGKQIIPQNLNKIDIKLNQDSKRINNLPSTTTGEKQFNQHESPFQKQQSASNDDGRLTPIYYLFGDQDNSRNSFEYSK